MSMNKKLLVYDVIESFHSLHMTIMSIMRALYYFRYLLMNWLLEGKRSDWTVRL